MANWRPEGWVTLKPKNHPLHCLAPNECVAQSFEAGADAMLEALKKKGGRIETGVGPIVTTLHVYTPMDAPPGTIVFIPDVPDKKDPT